MRDTLGKTKESLEFMLKVDQLTQEQRDHMRIVVNYLVDCYLKDDHRAAIIVGKDNTEQAMLLSINSNEMESLELLTRLQGYFTELVMSDAPPKEMMN
jgi:hypothetical protein